MVRVRIAPSPTGNLHVGTARTALFNYLFARQRKGVFVLRIEDTDRERSEPAFEHDIVEQLQWLGLHWDEGPGNEGPFGPYRQSERTDRYAEALRKLLDANSAYYCFCTEDALEKERESQRQRGEAPRYRGKCRTIDSVEAQRRVKRGERAVIRLKIPERTIVFHDLIRGEIRTDGRLIGDIIIAKDVRTPLYNFAAALDDIAMNITHVLRGEDHIANTPKQIIIAESLGFAPPAYGHFPLLLGRDRSKLSKRHGATSVKELRDAGYFPEAVVNFLAMLGWNPGTNQEVFRIEELIEAFDLQRVQKGGAIWNEEKLEWFNRQFLTHPALRWLSSVSTAGTPELIARAQRHVMSRGWQWDTARHSASLPLILERHPLASLEDAMDREYAFFFTPPDVPREMLRWKGMSDLDVIAALRKAREVLARIPQAEWGRARLERDLLHAAEASNKAKQSDRGRFLWPLRVALTGKKQSPPPFDVAAILGKDETLRRLTDIMHQSP